jgi:DNA primase
MNELAKSSDDWVERVRAASDIVEVIGERVALKRVGRNWTGLCPFHKERTPSFSVNPERQFYHCFSCKAGGDVFKFFQELEQMEFLEALEAAATAYEQWLADPKQGAEARAYLERRGLTQETLRAFRLGLAPAGWENLVTRLRGRVRDEVLI